MSLSYYKIKKIFGAIVLIGSVFGLGQFLFVDTVHAQSGALTANQCHCYCRASGGAAYAGKAIKKPVTPQDQKNVCSTLCKNSGLKELVCSDTMASNPVNNPTCFKRAQCENKRSSNGYDGVWDNKPAEDCLDDYRKCYAKSDNSQIWLNIPILNVKKVGDVSKYIRVVYEWMVKSGIVISTFLIIVGGLQYAFGAVSQEQISKAKKRIINSIIGLVLLLGSYLLLFTINPQLLNLKVPSMPLVKTLILPDNQTCDEYKKKGYKIDPSTPGKCGDTSALIEDPSGNNMASGSMCGWSKCDDSEERCTHANGKSQCLKCENIVEENNLGVTPSAGVCDPLSRKREGNKQEICIWTKDSELNSSTIETANFKGSCAMMNLDCSLVKSCDHYDNVKLSNVKYQNVDLDELESTSSFYGNMSLSQICVEDPCGIERKLGVTCFVGASDACDTKGAPRKGSNWDKKCDVCAKCGEGAFELCDADDEDECPQKYCDNKGGDSECIPRDCCYDGGC